MRRSILLWLLFVFTAGSGAGQNVTEVRKGNVFVKDAEQNLRQVTRSGHDAQPTLSPDGRKVAFVRQQDESSSELWIADVGGDAHERALVKIPIDVNGRRFNQAVSPTFSPDNATVYFLIQYAGTTNAILKVTTAGSKPIFVCAAMDFRIVPTGEYKGNLVARIRKAKLAPGYYEWYWLITPAGRELGVVGEDERDVEMFLSEQGQR